MSAYVYYSSRVLELRLNSKTPMSLPGTRGENVLNQSSTRNQLLLYSLKPELRHESGNPVAPTHLSTFSLFRSGFVRSPPRSYIQPLGEHCDLDTWCFVNEIYKCWKCCNFYWNLAFCCLQLSVVFFQQKRG